MLGSTNIVGFVPITDGDKARAFYEGVLGLRFIKDDGFAVVFEANEIRWRKTSDCVLCKNAALSSRIRWIQIDKIAI